MGEGKPIYFSNVTVVSLTKKGKTVTEKPFLSIEMPTTCETAKDFMSNDLDILYIAKRCAIKGMRSDEKLKYFKENFKVTRIDKGEIVGHQVSGQTINPDEYL